MIGEVSLKKPATLLALGITDAGGNPNFDDDYNAIINYATLQGFTVPSLEVQRVQNSLLVNLKLEGIWDDLDIFYNFFTDGDHNFAKINWKDPGAFQAVGTGHEPTFIELEGFKGNGTSQYLDTTWSPLTNGVKATQNNCSLFVSTVQAVSPASLSMFAANPNFRIYYELAQNKIRSGLNNAGAVASLVTGNSSNTFLHASRTTSILETLYRNGVADGTFNGATNTPLAQNIFILARNNAGVPDFFSAYSLSCMGVGASLQGKEAQLYNVWNTYKHVAIAVAAYRKIIDYATLQGFALPSPPQRVDQIRLIADLSSIGVWNDLDVFYNFVTSGDAGFAKINWKNPGTFQAVNIGVPGFAPNDGFTFNGTTSKLDTTIIPIVNTSKYKQDDACVFEDFLVSDPNDELPFGIFDGTYLTQLNSNVSTGIINYAINNAGAVATVSTTVLTSGFFHIKRTGAAVLALFKNGLSLHSGTTSSVTYAGAFTMQIGGRSGVTPLFRASKSLCFGMGASLNGKESTLYNAWKVYRDKYYVPAHPYDNVLAYAASQGFVAPSAPQQTLQRQLITDLMDAGIWDELDVFYNAQSDGDANFAKINWKSPGLFQAVTPAQVTFIPSHGFRHSGLGGTSITFGYNPTAFAGKFAQNNASMFYSTPLLTGGSNFDQYLLAPPSAGTILTIERNTGVQFLLALNGLEVTKNVAIKGFVHVQRKVSTEIVLFQDGTSEGAVASNSTAIPNVNLVALVGSSVPSEIACWGFGSSLNGLETSLFNAWNKYTAAVRSKAIYAGIIAYATSQAFTLPSAAQQVLDEKLIHDLIFNRIWSELDVFYNFLTDGDAGFAKINWKNPGTFQAVGTPTLIPLGGFSSAGTLATSLDTGFNFANTVNWTADNAGIYLDCTRFTGADGAYVGALASGANIFGQIVTAQAANITSVGINSNAAANPPLLSPVGFIQARRTAGNVRLYVNGVATGPDIAITNVAVGAQSFRIFGRNNGGVSEQFINATLLMTAFGSNLLNKEVTFFNIWNLHQATVRSKVAYAAIISYATSQAFTLPSAAIQTKGEKLIYDLMIARIWDSLDVFYNFYTDGDAGFAKINWKNPGVKNCVEIGTPVFTSLVGFTGSSVNALNTTFTPSTDGVEYKLNDSSFGLYSTDNAPDSHFEMGGQAGGAVNSSIISMRLVGSPNQLRYTVNQTGVRNATRTDGEAFVHVQRSSASVLKAFRNGTQIDSATNTSAALTSFPLYVCGMNNSGVLAHSVNTVSMAFAGSSLVGKELAFYNAWVAYKTP